MTKTWDKKAEIFFKPMTLKVSTATHLRGKEGMTWVTKLLRIITEFQIIKLNKVVFKIYLKNERNPLHWKRKKKTRIFVIFGYTYSYTWHWTSVWNLAINLGCTIDQTNAAQSGSRKMTDWVRPALRTFVAFLRWISDWN